MKKLTCRELGGPCDALITGATPEEMMKNGMAHLEAAHPEMVDGAKNMSKEESDKWTADFMQKWASAAEVAA